MGKRRDATVFAAMRPARLFLRRTDKVNGAAQRKKVEFGVGLSLAELLVEMLRARHGLTKAVRLDSR